MRDSEIIASDINAETWKAELFYFKTNIKNDTNIIMTQYYYSQSFYKMQSAKLQSMYVVLNILSPLMQIA